MANETEINNSVWQAMLGSFSKALVYTLCPSRVEPNTIHKVRPKLGHSSTYKSNLMAIIALD